MNAKPKCIKNNSVNMICLTETCTYSPFICQYCGDCVCINGHQLCKLVLWNGVISKIQNSKINESLKQKILLIDASFSRLEKELKVAHENFMVKVRNIQKKDVTEMLFDKNNKSISKKYINSLLSGKNYKESEDKLITKKQLGFELQKIDQKFKELIQKYEEITQEKKEKKICWDVINKPKTIEITGNIAKQTKKADGTSFNTFVILNKLLNDIKFTWGIKMLGEGMRIGICIKELIIANNYGHQGHKTPGHGAYVIGSGGITYNHKKNASKNGFTFTKGDIIVMEYNSQTNRLCFNKNDQSDVYCIDIPVPSAYQFYYPCVYLFNEGWAAQFIQI